MSFQEETTQNHSSSRYIIAKADRFQIIYDTTLNSFWELRRDRKGEEVSRKIIKYDEINNILQCMKDTLTFEVVRNAELAAIVSGAETQVMFIVTDGQISRIPEKNNMILVNFFYKRVGLISGNIIRVFYQAVLVEDRDQYKTVIKKISSTT
ncbi:hypothetical protein SCHPADRAFT_892933 [Schizopora paradoxa]|uniref:Uncharacterized protein n=1 Tax=Schizopora paradoxa TaxID=27342 RepID=A0A0H2RCT8_9AGAM|nr:hypothetical protein SCHPADRAFT_892933 [Schizopora paradoxa]